MNPERPPGGTTIKVWARIFLPFALGYYLSYGLRTVNAVIAPDLSREFSLTASHLGLLTSTYFLTFGAFQIPLGILLDRYGARRVEAALLAVCAAGCALFAAASGFNALVLGRALIGLGVSACFMAGLKAFQQWFEPASQPSLIGAIMVAGTLGALTAATPLEMALPAAGWRGVFWGLTALALAAAALLLTVPERGAGIAAQPLTVQLRGVAAIFAAPVFWRFAPQTCLVVGGFLALQGLWAVPWLMAVGGLTRSAAAAHLSYLNLALLFGYLGVALFSGRLARIGLPPLRLLTLGSGASVAMLVLALLDVGPRWLAWSALGLAMSASNLAYPLLSARFAPEMGGRANTALNLAAFVGAFGIQWGFGVLVDAAGAAGAGPAASFRLAAAVLALAQLAAFLWFRAGMNRA
ncbi:MAG: MFS transporter [Rhodocyclaceae bacterium]